MSADEIDPKKGEEMLGARARVEKTVRSTFRALYDQNKKEKAIRNFIVKEQAGFSSWREEVCRSYAREPDFGYCALRLTEARAIALGAQLAAGVSCRLGSPKRSRRRTRRRTRRNSRGADNASLSIVQPPLRINMPRPGSYARIAATRNALV